LAQSEFCLSERTACKLLGVERSSYRYEPRPDHNAELREQLVTPARQKPRYGYRRLHALLSRRGHEVNVKRIYRLYVEEQLMVRRKKRKRLVRDRAAEPRLTGANQEWAMDFVVDGLATGRMVRILSVVDTYTRECLALEADTSLGSGRVTRVLERVIAERGRPENVRSDNVLTREGKVGEKRRSFSIPYGMLRDNYCTSKWLPRARAERSTIATRDLSECAVSTVLKMKSQPSGRPGHYLRGPHGLDGPGEAALPLGAAASWKQRKSVPVLMIPSATRASSRRRRHTPYACGLRWRDHAGDIVRTCLESCSRAASQPPWRPSRRHSGAVRCHTSTAWWPRETGQTAESRDRGHRT
jgi:putative transposase